MRAKWIIGSKSIKNWKQIYEDNIHKELPKERNKKNVNRKGISLDKNVIWKTLLGCQITSVQKSGPESQVAQFLESNSPALSFDECKKNKINLVKFINDEIKNLRFNTQISERQVYIFNYLENGGWTELLTQLETIKTRTTLEKERDVVSYLCSKNFPGLGPKQGRNFIQWLGLSKYVIPLDTRTFTVMKRFGVSPVPKKGEGMSQEPLYRFFEDGMIQIAEKIQVIPCMLDACVFSSFDKK